MLFYLFCFFLAFVRGWIPDDESYAVRHVTQLDGDEVRDGTQRFSQISSHRGTSDAENIFVVYADGNRVPTINRVRYNGGMLGAARTALHGTDYVVTGATDRQFSVGIDETGRVHVAGDMDDYPVFPDRDGHLPASLQGRSCLMWRTKERHDLTSVTFVGGTPEGCPVGTGFKYLKFFNDNDGHLYAHYRVVTAMPNDTSSGARGLGMSRYNAAERRWELIGADVGDGFSAFAWEGTERSRGEFNEYLVQAHFDSENVMHVYFLLGGEAGKDRATYSVYAKSSDFGRTFTRLDGSAQPLPIRASNADVVSHRPEGFDRGFNPIAIAKLPSGDVLAFVGSGVGKYLTVHKSVAGAWVGVSGAAFPKVTRANENFVFYDHIGIPTMVAADGIYRFSSENDVVFHPVSGYDQMRADENYFRRTNSLLVLGTTDMSESHNLHMSILRRGGEPLPSTPPPTTTNPSTPTTSTTTTTTRPVPPTLPTATAPTTTSSTTTLARPVPTATTEEVPTTTSEATTAPVESTVTAEPTPPPVSSTTAATRTQTTTTPTTPTTTTTTTTTLADEGGANAGIVAGAVAGAAVVAAAGGFFAYRATVGAAAASPSSTADLESRDLDR
eukprot:Polyplicarium_translucidae@DN2582_c0_g1_i1.p1